MDKSKKIKILSAVSIIGAILAITVAFALITRSMVINGSGNVKPALWDIHFKDISEPTITGGASVITSPTVADKGAKIDNLEVRLTLPQDKIEYTVYIENSGDMNAKIDDIKYPTLTEEESKIFKFSARYYSNNSPMQVGDVLKAGQIKKVIITIEYLDISDKNLLPKETKTIDIDFKIKYVQDNNSYTTTTNQTTLLPDGYKECEYLASTGTQYIDTKFIYKDSPRIVTTLKASAGDYDAWGVINNTSPSWIGDFYTYHYNHTAMYYRYGPTKSYNITFDVNMTSSWVDIDIGKNVYINSQLLYTASDYNFSNNNQSVMLFRGRNYTKAAFKRTKLYDSETLYRDLIPALDDNDIPCMYDTVSGNTFYNEGTGEFNYQLK